MTDVPGEFKVDIDGDAWHTRGDYAAYDAIHAAAGAVLAGAGEVTIIREGEREIEV